MKIEMLKSACKDERAEDTQRGVEEGGFVCSRGLQDAGLEIFEALFGGVEELEGEEGEVDCVDGQVSEEGVLT